MMITPAEYQDVLERYFIVDCAIRAHAGKRCLKSQQEHELSNRDGLCATEIEWQQGRRGNELHLQTSRVVL